MRSSGRGRGSQRGRGRATGHNRQVQEQQDPWGDAAVLGWLRDAEAREEQMREGTKQRKETMKRKDETDCGEGVREFVALVGMRCSI